jgi:hypothetical protein
MRWRSLRIGLLLIVTAPGMPLRVGTAPIGDRSAPSGLIQASDRSRVDAWREDLAFFAQRFASVQRDFSRLYPGNRFSAGIESLTRAIPTATDADLVLALMRTVASARVAHTLVQFPTAGPLAFHRLPLGFQWFSDGLAVTAATEPYRDAIGLRVASIGTMAAEDVKSAVARYISYENEGWLRQQSQSLMLAEELLRTLGLVDPDGRVTLTLARADGSTVNLRVAAVPWADTAPLITVVQARQIPPGPARLQPNRYYRYELLPEARAIYVRYSRCAEDPQQPFAAFTAAMFDNADREPAAVGRVVIDLRANGGGDSSIIRPLLGGLRARPSLSSRGRLYALVGPATFSSGLLAAVALKKDLKAILVGEPPGEKPNSYGEARPLTLPHSGLIVQYSTKFFRLVPGDPTTYDPDVAVGRTIADLVAGRDPVLDAALTHSPR